MEFYIQHSHCTKAQMGEASMNPQSHHHHKKLKNEINKSFHEEIRVQQPPLPLKQNRGKKKYTDKTPK